MGVLDELVPKLAELPGVVAVVLGGSRAEGTDRPDSDWDIGVYYRSSFDADLLAGLGCPGHAAQSGEWGRIVNGGAWLSVQGQPDAWRGLVLGPGNCEGKATGPHSAAAVTMWQ